MRLLQVLAAALLLSGLLVCQADEGKCSATGNAACSSSEADAAAEHPVLAAVVMYRTLNETNLNRTLASIVDVVDSIVLVPPSDAFYWPDLENLPAEALQKMVAHHVKWTVNYSSARNAALQVAQEEGATWAVLLDDSEVLQLDPSHASLKDYLAASNATIFHCIEEQPYTKPRFLKLPTASYFDGPTHEILLSNNNEVVDMFNVTFPKHEGLDGTILLSQDRYVLELYIAQGTDLAPRWHYYLGHTIALQGQVGDAAKAYEKAASLSTSAEAAAWAFFKAGEALYGNGNVHGAKQALLNAMHLNPGMPEAPWLLSFIAYKNVEYHKAANWATLATAVGCYKGNCASASRDGYRALDTWFKAPYEILMYVEWQVGEGVGVAAAQKELEAASEAQDKFAGVPVTSLYHTFAEFWKVGSSSAQPEKAIGISEAPPAVSTQKAAAASGRAAAAADSAATAAPPVGSEGDAADGSDMGFYIPPKHSVFHKLFLETEGQPASDKVTCHHYDSVYSKYFESDGRRFRKLKLLEIGLGCFPMHYEGASAKMWMQYLPNSEMWYAEYDAACVERTKDRMKEVGIKGILIGDQSDNDTLHKWVDESGGNFDVIIDDGGHESHHILNSFNVLFEKALKPGGLYVLEDVHVQQLKSYRGVGPLVQEVVSDWVQSIMQPIGFGKMEELWLEDIRRSGPGGKAGCFLGNPRDDGAAFVRDIMTGPVRYLPKFKLPRGVKFIDCSAEACAVVKCLEDDPFCPDGLVDPYVGPNPL